MNILFVSLHSPITYLGGAEILTLVLAESLVELGHHVTIYTAGTGRRYKVHGVIIQETPLFMFPLRFRTTLLPLYSLLLDGLFSLNRDFRSADIVHAIDSGAIVLLSGWRFLRHKFVATIQDYSLIWPNKDYFSFGREIRRASAFTANVKGWIRKKVNLSAVGRLQYAICVSKFVAEKYSEVNVKTKVSIIGNCISPSWKKPGKHVTRDIDILYVGKLMPYKGLDVLLSALPQLPTNRALHIAIVGEGLDTRYKTQVKKMNLRHKVIFTGPVPYRDIPGHYQRAKIVVSPSIWPEPCGRSIIEAMWSGCAVVATNVGGTPESLIDKVHGYLVDPRSSLAISRACKDLLVHPKIRNDFSRQASLYAWKYYSLGWIAKKYLSFYGLIKSG